MLNKYTSALVLALLAAEASAVRLDEDGFPDADDCVSDPFGEFCKEYC